MIAEIGRRAIPVEMDAVVVRRFAIGPFPSQESLHECAVVPASDPAEHALVATRDGIWLCTSDGSLRDRALGRLAGEYALITIDCWNSLTEEAVVARFRIERHRGASAEVEHADRRHSDLARGGVLSIVAADWLAQLLRKLASMPQREGPTKKDLLQRERTQRFLQVLVDGGTIALADGSTIDDLMDRARRILFRIAGTRSEAVGALLRMLDSSKHVAKRSGGDIDPTRASLEVGSALEGIRYRK